MYSKQITFDGEKNKIINGASVWIHSLRPLKHGITIRIGVDTLRVMGRATQGVKIIRLKEDDSIASVAKVTKAEEDVNCDKSNNSENNDINVESENE